VKTEQLARALNVIADILIPPSGEWPAPSALQIGADLLTRVRADERAVLVSVSQLLDLDGAMSDVDDDVRSARLKKLASTDPLLFDVLRRCLYYAYYAQPSVVRVLRDKGYDINEAPQPHGYRMDPITPEDLAGIDRRRVVWIPAELVGASLRRAS